RRHGVDPSSITVAWVPGAFELPIVARRLASSGRFDAVVCLGAVIRGETGHYEHVAGQCAAGIQRSQLETGVPVVFGVLTTETVEQALARSRSTVEAGGGGGEDGVADGDADNKGFESAVTALEMADLLRQLPAPC
ncbi:MAG: 6,7-dimethyl-8-ribityllumazine synthase, partial [Acidimicrobiales bacterium]